MKALKMHYQKILNTHLQPLFGDDPGRGNRMAAEGSSLYPDYSNHRITDETIRCLVKPAEPVRRDSSTSPLIRHYRSLRGAIMNVLYDKWEK